MSVAQRASHRGTALPRVRVTAAVTAASPYLPAPCTVLLHRDEAFYKVMLRTRAVVNHRFWSAEDAPRPQTQTQQQQHRA